MKVIEKEIECLKRVELMKQQLVSQFDYSVLSIFRAIDRYAHGKVNADNLRLFLRGFECSKALDESDISTWIARFDRDVDGGLDFVDLVNALQTMTNYQPKVVQRANGTGALEEPVLTGGEGGLPVTTGLGDSAAQMNFQDGYGDQLAQLAPQIGVEDMGGEANLTGI